MKQRKRIYYSVEQRAEIWDRWRRGESMSSIGRRFDRESSSVFSVLSPSGPHSSGRAQAFGAGVEPGGARGGLKGCSRGTFAQGDRGPAWPGALDDQPGSRAERRAGPLPGDRVRSGRRGSGRCAPSPASWLAIRRCAEQCRQSCAATGRPSRLRAGWGAVSPTKSSTAWSHETIYKSLYIQARGVLKKELLEHLRGEAHDPAARATPV